jgi:hypothetical protein
MNNINQINIECKEFNDFFKMAEEIIRRAEEYRLKQQELALNQKISENNTSVITIREDPDQDKF